MSDDKKSQKTSEKKKKSGGGGGMANPLLIKQFKELSSNPPDGFDVGLVEDNIYEWHIMIEGPKDTDYEGGFFPARLSFPPEFPNKPPTMTFLTQGFWHPNVYPDGKVCISILHENKDDLTNEQELRTEKWRPVLGVESILISVVSMLSDPNFSSPANIEASVQLRNDPRGYRKRIRDLVRKSQDAL